MPGFLSGYLGVGGVDAVVSRRTDASGTDAEHQAIVDDVAVEAWIVALQKLGCDAVGIGDAFARVLVGALVNKLAVVAVTSKAELRADFERVTIGTSIEKIEGEDLVGGGKCLLTNLVARVAILDCVMMRAGGIVGMEDSARRQRQERC